MDEQPVSSARAEGHSVVGERRACAPPVTGEAGGLLPVRGAGNAQAPEEENGQTATSYRHALAGLDGPVRRRAHGRNVPTTGQGCGSREQSPTLGCRWPTANRPTRLAEAQ